MKRLWTILVLAVATAACGGDKAEIQHDGSVNPVASKVRGSITGRVLDPAWQPVETAKVIVTLPDGPRSFPVDEEGYFLIEKLPAGVYLEVRVEAEGYAYADTKVWLEAEAGEYAQNDISADLGNLLLFPRGDSYEFPVLTSTGEQLMVEGATCSFSPRWVEDWGSGHSGVSYLEVEAEAGEALIRCPDMPSLEHLARFNGRIEIRIPAQDLDGDGHAEFGGFVGDVAAIQLLQNGMAPIHLSRTADAQALEIVQSNLMGLVNPMHVFPAFPRDADIEITFSHPVEVHSHWVADFEAETFEEAKVDSTVEADGNQVRITIAEDLRAGYVYGATMLVSPLGLPGVVHSFMVEFLTTSSGAIEVSATFVDADDDDMAAPDESIRLEFSEWIYRDETNHRFFVQIDADLDGSGVIGDAAFELGSDALAEANFNALAVQDEYRVAEVRVPVELPAGVEMVLFMEERPYFDANENRLMDMSATLTVAD